MMDGLRNIIVWPFGLKKRVHKIIDKNLCTKENLQYNREIIKIVLAFLIHAVEMFHSLRVHRSFEINYADFK